MNTQLEDVLNSIRNHYGITAKDVAKETGIKEDTVHRKLASLINAYPPLVRSSLHVHGLEKQKYEGAKMSKYDKSAQKKWLKTFVKWEESKAIGKAEMLLALVSMCAIGFLFGCFS